jgi:GTP cyclohydrolase I
MIDKQKIEKGVELFLKGLGIDTTDQHFKGTPGRVAKAWAEYFGAGYDIDPKKYLNVEFSDDFDQMILVKDIPLISHCAHHMVPFCGTAKVGYLPANKRITGLSKLARVVQGYAARLQIQEQLTRQIAQALHDVLKPKGCGVVIEAEHFCMSRRGVRATGSKTVTSYLMGSFRDEPETRAEFLRF